MTEIRKIYDSTPSTGWWWGDFVPNLDPQIGLKNDILEISRGGGDSKIWIMHFSSGNSEIFCKMTLSDILQKLNFAYFREFVNFDDVRGRVFPNFRNVYWKKRYQRPLLVLLIRKKRFLVQIFFPGINFREFGFKFIVFLPIKCNSCEN